jgi:hypothetical protein
MVIVDAERDLMKPCRSTRRQRTTPSVLGSGTVSTIAESSAI